MTNATILLLKNEMMGDLYFKRTSVDLLNAAAHSLNEGKYEAVSIINLPKEYTDGQDAAEEVFDLTNNPSREDESRAVYGNRRSLSVGDIVLVNGVFHLCAHSGWLTM